MTDPVPNLPLLRKVLDQIDAEPASWHQASWGIRWDSEAGRAELPYSLLSEEQVAACGAAYCIAGHAAVMAGYDLEFSHEGEAAWTTTDESVEAVARRELGLTDAERRSLFAGGNSRGDVQYAAELIAARAGESL